MLLVDYRVGSAELLKPLQALGLPAESGDIPADLAWEGRGEKGAPVMVGVEFKKLEELVQSLRTQRLQGHQLLKMRDNFQFCYLLIEGELHYDHTGRLTKRVGRQSFRPMPGGMVVSELLKRLSVLYLCGGLIVVRARTRTDSLQEIAALYRTWTDTDLDKHKSHIAIYQAPTLVPLSEFRGFVTRFDGLGLKTSKAVETHFGGKLRKAITATKEEWMKIDGVGEVLASHIQEVLNGTSK